MTMIIIILIVVQVVAMGQIGDTDRLIIRLKRSNSQSLKSAYKRLYFYIILFFVSMITTILIA